MSDLAFKIHETLSIPPQDIAILTEYNAQWRTYVEEADQRQTSPLLIDWHQLQDCRFCQRLRGNAETDAEKTSPLPPSCMAKDVGFFREHATLPSLGGL